MKLALLIYLKLMGKVRNFSRYEEVCRLEIEHIWTLSHVISTRKSFHSTRSYFDLYYISSRKAARPGELLGVFQHKLTSQAHYIYQTPFPAECIFGYCAPTSFSSLSNAHFGYASCHNMGLLSIKSRNL